MSSPEGKDTSTKITNAIIKAFIVKRRKAMIDQDNQNSDLVSYETSEERIINLMSFIAILSCIIVSALALSNIHIYWSNPQEFVPMNVQSFSTKLRPNVALIFQDGHIEIFGLNWTKLIKSWDFKVPKVIGETGYFAYTDINALNIIYSDGKKDTTVLHGKRNHYTILKSKIPKSFLFSARTVKFGHQLWIFGGQTTEYLDNYGQMTFYGHMGDFMRSRNDTLLWNIIKHRSTK